MQNTSSVVARRRRPFLRHRGRESVERERREKGSSDVGRFADDVLSAVFFALDILDVVAVKSEAAMTLAKMLVQYIVLQSHLESANLASVALPPNRAAFDFVVEGRHGGMFLLQVCNQGASVHARPM